MADKTDYTLEDLKRMEAALLADAEAAGEHPETRTKSSFKTEADKLEWINLFGLQAYQNLRD
jgi:hypothetical protein